MKKITFIIYCFCAFATAFAQQAETDFDALVAAERNAAGSLTTFTANANTGNYDVTYHRLEFTVNPAIQFITGKVTTTYTAKEDMATITFDLINNLTVSSVTKNGASLAFSQNGNNELVITLPTTQAQGTAGTVVINYSGVPIGNQNAFSTDSHNGTPVLWTISQPYGAMEWWPCKQDLNDKIDNIDVYITAPSQYTSVANGVEQSQIDNGGSTTTHFKHNYPIPAYLIAIAVTNYSIFTQQYGTAPNNFPIVNYLYPETQAQTQQQVGQTLPIMQFFEDTFEPYPYPAEKYGHAQCGFGGGMEHTTVSFMGSFGRELIAHELAHQWFGNKVTCGSWKDIWLNEGLATYLSALVIENQDGDEAFRQWRFGRVTSVTSQPDGSVYLSDADTLNVGRVFSSRLSYNKGAMVTHMLRRKMGDAAFYQGLKNYLADEDLAFAYAKTPQMQQHLETESGMDLQEFFNDWIYQQGYPTYNVIVSPGSPEHVNVTVSQSQSHPSVSFFEAQVPVRFYGFEGQTYDALLDNTFNNQMFTVPVPFAIASAEVNPDFDIISANNNVQLDVEQFNLQSIKLYPNPANSTVNLQVPGSIIVQNSVIYNALGQQVMATGNATSWNISALTPGMYFINIGTSNGNTQLKFIKE